MLHEYNLQMFTLPSTVYNSHLIYCLHYSCSVALCPNPADIVNGMVTFTGNSVGDTATYTCNSGFELIRNASVACTQLEVSSAAFSPAAPVCRREYYMIMNRLKRGLRYHVHSVIYVVYIALTLQPYVLIHLTL